MLVHPTRYEAKGSLIDKQQVHNADHYKDKDTTA